MSDKSEPTTVLGVAKKIRGFMEETRAKQGTTDKLTEANSDATVNHIAQVRSQVKELEDRLNTIERI
ncbi:hypothetical protein GcM1_151003 [Golovinomyces cichoracearum]|uniref:Uncharacterized protein n=1 Tax=Golovinomyces cichoracearum TaxID=62708 RepID=A0A420JAS6_9PEZI|nr:hypothetical protein GcM1_151003 [Golovinomyces cichoracearum]